uniref:CUB domain-containing protein n=2 Tax=Pectinophora gossypiella TaxID=13191 RepID=A0A1E1WFY2_PECGO
MVLAQPDGDGVCTTDSVTVTGGNTVVPTICGDNTGQTIFVDFDGNTAITITVTATLATTFSRRWNIKLTQLGCDCPGIAPNGCLQYYTGLTGTIRSFNYGTAANTALSASLVTGTHQIANLNYGICIRMEAGYCAIQYSQTANDIYSFTVTGDVEGADNTVLGTAVGAANDGNCVTDFVVIPNPTVAATGLAVGTDRFCGLGFVTVTSASKPFVLYVVTNGDEGATATTPPDVANRGFSLAYAQIAC